jgi:hypothetical protein
MSVRIDVGGDDAAVADLWQWLNAERELRGRVRLEAVPPPPGAMGGTTEIVLQVAGLATAVLSTARTATG